MPESTGIRVRAGADLQPDRHPIRQIHARVCAKPRRTQAFLSFSSKLRPQLCVIGSPRLCIGNDDRSRHTLLVRMSKFGKSRTVALSRDARRKPAAYLQRRLCFRKTASSPLLAHGEQAHKAHSGTGFGTGFRNLCRAAGVLTAFGVPPRIHDMRHTHAANVLLNCYRENGNPQAVLPVLSRSIGHASLASTAYYLSWIDPVIEQAVARVARHIPRS